MAKRELVMRREKLLATKRLEVVVPGLCATRAKDVPHTDVKYKGYVLSGSSADYMEKLLFITKCAMAEQDWELTDGPLYMAVIVHKPIPKTLSKTDPKKTINKWKQTPMQECTPGIFNILRLHLLALKGIVFRNYSQFVSTFVLRVYDNDPCTELIFGQADTVKELLHDIRNL